MIGYIRRHLRRFATDCHASVAAEFVLILPALAWAYAGGFVYFQSFRTVNTNMKAAYTVADLVSRQTQELDPSYIEGLNTVFDYLNRSTSPSHIRISSVTWDAVTLDFKLNWSYATRDFDSLTDATLDTITDRLPAMAIGDTEIVVETWSNYTPAFNMPGVDARTIHEFVVTRPRLGPQVVFNPDGSASS